MSPFVTKAVARASIGIAKRTLAKNVILILMGILMSTGCDLAVKKVSKRLLSIFCGPILSKQQPILNVKNAAALRQNTDILFFHIFL